MWRMRCLITGGAGFIGSNFIRYLTHHNGEINIINIDKLTYAGNLKNLKDVKNKKNYIFIKEDICNSSEMHRIFKYYKPDYLINFAAESHVDRSIENSEEFVKTNVLGTQILLQCSLNMGIKKYIQVSTDEVYGSIEKGLCTETSSLKPNNPYAASKAAGDLLAQSFFNTYKLPIIITRCSNNYGPYQHHEKLIPKTIINVLNRRKVPVYGDGENVRDWIYVLDHCRAIYTILQRGSFGEIYNISSNDEKRNIDIVRKIIRETKEILLTRRLEARGISEDLIEFVTDRKGHDRRYSLNASKLRSSFSWKADTEFEYGLTKTIEWYIDNKEHFSK